MPFQSEAQRRFMFARKPKIAKRWAKKYGTPKNMPYHKSKKKKRSKYAALGKAIMKAKGNKKKGR